MQHVFARPDRFRPWAALLALAVAAGCGLVQDEDDGSSEPGEPGGSSGGSMVTLPGGGSSGASGGSGSVTPPAPACETLQGLGQCGGSSVEANFKTVNILLVIDKSGSMTDTPEGFEEDKWSSIKVALEAALSDVAADINFGLVLYPLSHVQPIALNCRDRCCEVPEGLDAVNVGIGPGTEKVPEILRVLDQVSPGGGTPTAAALERAHLYFTQGAGATLEGERYVLLATDGGPNCNSALSCDKDSCTTNLDGQCSSTGSCCTGLGAACVDDDSVNAQISALATDGIPTFVVGIPGTEAYAPFLNEFAQSGGVPALGGPPDYYAVSAEGGVQGLIDVFSTITTQLVRSCEIELASEPPRLDEVNVAVDCEVVRPMNEDDDSGWQIDNSQRPNLLLLKGGLCERVQAQGARRVDVVYGCPTIR